MPSRRKASPRLLGLTMEFSAYVLADGTTRVVSVEVFNAQLEREAGPLEGGRHLHAHQMGHVHIF